MCFSRMDVNIKTATFNIKVFKDTAVKETEKAKVSKLTLKLQESDVNSIVSRLQSIRSDLDRVQANLEQMQQTAFSKQCNSGLFDQSKGIYLQFLEFIPLPINEILLILSLDNKQDSSYCMTSRSINKVRWFTFFKIIIILGVIVAVLVPISKSDKPHILYPHIANTFFLSLSLASYSFKMLNI